MSTFSAKFTCVFEDGKTTDITLSPLKITGSTGTTIKNFINTNNNSSTRESNFPGFDDSFVSTGGAPFVSISGAQIVATQRTVLF